MRALLGLLAIGACAQGGIPEEELPPTSSELHRVVQCWQESQPLPEAPTSSQNVSYCQFRPEGALPFVVRGAHLEFGEGKPLVHLPADIPVPLASEQARELEAVVLTFDASETAVGPSAGSTSRIVVDATQIGAGLGVGLPFDVWPVTLRSLSDRNLTLRFKHDLGGGLIAEGDIDIDVFGSESKWSIAVARGDDEVPAAIRIGRDTAIAYLGGPGLYRVDGSLAVVPDEAAEMEPGMTAAGCEVSRSPLRLVCAATNHPGIVATTVDVRGASGQSWVLPLDEGFGSLSLSDSALPIEVTIRTRLADEVHGLQTFDDTYRFHAALGLGDKVEAALPFELWEVNLIASAATREAVIELPSYYVFFSELWEERFVVEPPPRFDVLEAGESRQWLLAVSPGTAKLPLRISTESGQGLHVLTPGELSIGN